MSLCDSLTKLTNWLLTKANGNFTFLIWDMTLSPHAQNMEPRTCTSTPPYIGELCPGRSWYVRCMNRCATQLSCASSFGLKCRIHTWTASLPHYTAYCHRSVEWRADIGQGHTAGTHMPEEQGPDTCCTLCRWHIPACVPRRIRHHQTLKERNGRNGWNHVHCSSHKSFKP